MCNSRLGKACWIFFVGILVIAASWGNSIRARRVPVDKAPSELTLSFICPNREGVCLWNEKLGWRKLLTSPSDALVEFHDTGQISVLVRGHGNPGKTIVADHDGRVKVVKNNAVEGNLARITGWDSKGNVVLCSDTPEEARCDTFIPKQANDDAVPWFPVGCLFPRFLDNGERACLVSLPEPAILLVSGDRDVRRINLPAELSNPADFYGVSSSQFIFLVDNSLYTFVLGSGSKVIHGGVLWVDLVGDTILFACYQDREGGSVGRYRFGDGFDKLWSSPSLVPIRALKTSRGLFVDAWGGGRREITFLPAGAKGEDRIVWKEGPSTLWQ